MSRAQAAQRLADEDLTLGDVERRASEDVPRGRVISQDPEPGSFLPPGDPVDVVISTGKPEVVVPDVLGDDRADARNELEDLDLKVKLVEEDSDEPRNTVVEMDPRPATSVSVGSLVTLYYSDGPEQVPSVLGMTEEQATRALKRAGFSVNVTYDSETRAERGTVLEQSPEAFRELPAGTTVVITVSAYEEPTPTPSETVTETSEPPTPSPTVSDPTSPTEDEDE